MLSSNSGTITGSIYVKPKEWACAYIHFNSRNAYFWRHSPFWTIQNLLM